MALVYFDASALVKLCVPEAGTLLASRLWNRADVVATSRLSDTELRAALAAGLRAGVLDAAEHAEAIAAWESLWPALHVVEVTSRVAAQASVLLDGTGPGGTTGAHGPTAALRSNDAVHVASALAVAHDDTLVAAWDPVVAAGARGQGLRVVP
ncbi:type II toxin-antitoxin system VapC family toxin [Cellulosimicrobium sp. CUA-896]|uniref:type II toxin-antitoxin system VapC family toxin n=1 Tax=Cellulosimicrobium sp. CUA-896 TaxID=1517881 RepID=UPI0009661DB5|nr:type II toxin-antitoxin system VapC family toxin [Cellulosimicrobium sp. CUA-896]OLT52258.1 twitching motility protein PilT [Cellulosimicrobium sp. CUA-896]